jgi:3-oxoisoapionate kinase
MTTLRLAFYGDDFSGSTDALEVLAKAGLRTRLFLAPPLPADVSDCDAVGLAGTSRALPTDQMDAVLRPAFESLMALSPQLVHYKVCSTFDSSPAVGSIGRAIDVGASVFGERCVPLVVGAPFLGRHVAFGNLFARSGLDSPVYRLDRHPTMTRHPVTPMHESDLRHVLAEQTDRPVELVDVTQLADFAQGTSLPGPPDHAAAPILLFDTIEDHHLPLVGRALLARRNAAQPIFTVGSSGLEAALVAAWRELGELPAPPVFPAESVDRLLVVSGSCSPVTARQLAWARNHGFQNLPLSPEDWLHADEPPAAIIRNACDHLRRGESVIVHAADGPDDPRIAAVRQQGPTDLGPRLGRCLGRLVNQVVGQTELRRVVVAGGDTSGFVARQLGIHSLEYRAPIAPGSPLCRVSAPGFPLDHGEIVFKGGQVGKEDCYELVRLGQPQS